MILYQLQCGMGHQFEAWFRDSASYAEQARNGSVECPFCGDAMVERVLTAPKLLKGGLTDSASETRAREVAEEILKAVGKLRDHLEDAGDYVGERFPDEARSIHYGDAEDRLIYGEASDEEASELAEEGIDVFRVPGSPRRDS